MPYKELGILLPCHSLEDFPTHYDGDDAAGLLAGWTGLWHPLLIHQAQSIVGWHRMDDPPEDLADRLLVVPSVSADGLPTGYVQRARDSGATVVRRETSRSSLIEQALVGHEVPEHISDDLVGEFLALGYCYLQIQLLTRQMRYASNLDELHFQNLVVAAADLAMAGDLEKCNAKLQACFDLLSEERDHYYSVDAYIVDIIMLAGTTLGPMLRDELSRDIATNCVLSAELANQLSKQHSDVAELVKQCIQENQLTVVGGEFHEGATSLMHPEEVLDGWNKARDVYESSLGIIPKVYGRRRFGFTSNMPQWLSRFGITAALHVGLDDGSNPESSQAKTRWEGRDGSSIDAIARVPLNASLHETYLSLATKLGESMDMDHVATLCLAHWPAKTPEWFDDLVRISRRTSALGRFVTLQEYFETTDIAPLNEVFDADRYKSPYLKQAIIRNQEDPISKSVRRQRRLSKLRAAEALSTTSQLLGANQATDLALLKSQIYQVDQPFGDEQSSSESAALDESLDQAIDTAANQLAHQVPRDGDVENGCLILNPCAFTRRTFIDDTGLEVVPNAQRPVYAASNGQQNNLIVDVPSMGFSWIGEQSTDSGKPSTGPPMAEGMNLRNEFMEILFSETTGGIQSVISYDQARVNRVSQQLAIRKSVRRKDGRWAEVDDEANYSVMAADSVEVTASTSLAGEVTSRGRIMNRDGTVLARFTQIVRLTRGSRVINVKVTIQDGDSDLSLKGNPWENYLCARFAWVDEAANLYRTINGVRHPANGRRLEAPEYLEIDGEGSTTILTGGLPVHRRIGYRMLDSLLVTKGETCREFEFGIGIDLKYPSQQAADLHVKPVWVKQQAAPPKGNHSSWLFHLSARNVNVTAWTPIHEEGQVVGCRLRVMESRGRQAKVTLSTFRKITTATQCNLDHSVLGDCPVEDGKATFELSPHEWLELDVRW